MAPVIHVLHRGIVIEFYKQNAAFFGLIILIIFGFIKTSEHIVIGSFLVANPSSLAFLYLIWIAYGIKVILFIIPTIQKEEYQFLVSFYILPLRIKIFSSFIAIVSISIPIIIYAVFLILLAFKKGYYVSVISLLSSQLIIISGLTSVLINRLNGLPYEHIFLQIKFLNRAIRPPFVFFAEYLVRNDIVLFFLTKLYTCLLIIGTSSLYTTDQFDLRLLTTGVLLAFVGNVTIVHKYVWFQYHKLRFSANLPLPFHKMLPQLFATFSMLIIPEYIVLLRYYPLPPEIMDMAGILFFALSLLLLIYALLLKKQVELSNFIIVIFWLIVIYTFIILFSVHPIFLATLNFFISISIIYFRHRKFEFVEKSH